VRCRRYTSSSLSSRGRNRPRSASHADTSRDIAPPSRGPDALAGAQAAGAPGAAGRRRDEDEGPAAAGAPDGCCKAGA
jgi:hypothetical protein